MPISEASEEPIRPGDKVVTTTEAAVKVGTRTLATVPANTQLIATAVKDHWVAVTVQQGGKSISGWIHRKHLSSVDAVQSGTFAEPAMPRKKDVAFEYNTRTVKSATLREMGEDGYALSIALSDSGWKELQRICAQRPERIAIRIAGRVVTHISDPGTSGQPVMPKEHLWTGPALGEDGKSTLGRGGVYGFSKEEAEMLAKSIMTPKQAESDASAGDRFTALCRAYFGADLKSCGRVLAYPPGPGGSVSVAEITLHSPRSGLGTYQVMFEKPVDSGWRILMVRPAKTPGDFRGLWSELEPWNPTGNGTDHR